MPIRRGTFASSVNELPSVSIDSVTNFNQSQATFNATVSANAATTTVYYDYSTTSSFVSFTTVTATTGLTGQNQSVPFTVTGLSVGTVYYVRVRAVNGVGSVTSGSTLFTTWSVKTYLNTTAGAFSVSVPSIPGVAPSIFEMLLYGAGGGANYGGGGGGGYRLAANHVSSVTGTQTVSGTVGAGGAAGNGGTGVGTATAGGSTTLTVGSTTWTGGGGGAGNHPGNCGAPFGRGGTVGTGTNGSNLGGTNTYGYTYSYVSGYNQWTDPSCGCCATDKLGFCITFCTCNNPNSPIYSTATDCGYYATGGGGGTDAAGGNAATQGTASHVGGNGGMGGGAYGLRGGNGGGGQGTQGNGSAGGFSVGSGTIVGTGGSVFSAGTAGGITFKYYGP